MNKIAEVFLRFLALGCMSFGGPAAHIGYFRTTFVQELKWLDDESYTRLISLSQFLPGPASSQIGFAICGHKPTGNGIGHIRFFCFALNENTNRGTCYRIWCGWFVFVVAP